MGKTCNGCGMHKRKSIDVASFTVGATLGTITGVILCLIARCVEAVI